MPKKEIEVDERELRQLLDRAIEIIKDKVTDGPCADVPCGHAVCQFLRDIEKEL